MELVGGETLDDRIARYRDPSRGRGLLLDVGHHRRTCARDRTAAGHSFSFHGERPFIDWNVVASAAACRPIDDLRLDSPRLADVALRR
jgi:hypothetical protein